MSVALGDAVFSPLLLVAAADNVQIRMELLHRGEVLAPSTLSGETLVTVDGGVAFFTGVRVQGVAGTGFQQKFSYSSAPGGWHGQP